MLGPNGLHVRGLECVVASLEENDACVLPDYSALEYHSSEEIQELL